MRMPALFRRLLWRPDPKSNGLVPPEGFGSLRQAGLSRSAQPATGRRYISGA